eukprot:Opistho-1_new@86810
MVQPTFATPAQAAPADERDLIVSVVSSVLNKMVSRAESQQHGPLTRFDASKIPGISIQSYLDRIVNFAPCSPECFIIALVYIDRVVKMNPKFVITAYNIHRLLITSTMLAAKYLDDCYYNNSFYAKVGGVPAAEMNILELEFLRLVDFGLSVSKPLYDQYRYELHRQQRPASTASLPSPPAQSPVPAHSPALQQPSPRHPIQVAQGHSRHLPLSPVSQQASPIPKMPSMWPQAVHGSLASSSAASFYQYVPSTPVRCAPTLTGAPLFPGAAAMHQQLQVQQHMAAMPPMFAAHAMLQMGIPSPSPSPFPQQVQQPHVAHAQHATPLGVFAVGPFAAPHAHHGFHVGFGHCECFSDREHCARIEQNRSSAHVMCMKLVEAEIEAQRLPAFVAARALHLLALEEARVANSYAVCTQHAWSNMLRAVLETLAMENAGLTSVMPNRAYKGFIVPSVGVSHAVA